MKKIGVLHGVENTFPGALVERINGMGVNDVDQLDTSHLNTALLKLEMPQLDRERMLGKL